MKIIQDSREQLPMFKEATVRKMDTGDYTTILLDGVFHIERKSPEDLYSTLIQDHARFKREILRAKKSDTKLVVYVESSKEDFINKRFSQGWMRKTKSETLAKIIATMSKKYNLEFVWCFGRKNMEIKMIQRFEEEEKKLNNGE